METDNCCGNCFYFHDEDIRGMGLCDYFDNRVYCEDVCEEYSSICEDDDD